MRPKLYLATKKIDVMFLTNYQAPSAIQDTAERFLEKEAKNIDQERITVKEVTSKEDIPKDWQEAFLWGIDRDMTALQFLEDPEYLEYLRLKKKFEE